MASEIQYPAVRGSATSGTNTGDVTLGAVGSTPSANGASLSGQVLTLQPASQQFPGLVPAGTPYLPAFGLRRWYQLSPGTAVASVFTGIGIGAPGTTGTPSAAAGTADPTLMMIKYLSGAVSGNTAGITLGSFSATCWDFRPKVTSVVRTDTAITSQRIYIGLADADISGNGTLAASNSNRVAVFRFDSGLGDTNWMAMSSDGTTASATDTGVVVAANTTYTLDVDMSVAGHIKYIINRAATPQVDKITNVPTGLGANTAPGAVIVTLTAAARTLYIARIAVEQN